MLQPLLVPKKSQSPHNAPDIHEHKQPTDQKVNWFDKYFHISKSEYHDPDPDPLASECHTSEAGLSLEAIVELSFSHCSVATTSSWFCASLWDKFRRVCQISKFWIIPFPFHFRWTKSKKIVPISIYSLHCCQRSINLLDDTESGLGRLSTLVEALPAGAMSMSNCFSLIIPKQAKPTAQTNRFWRNDVKRIVHPASWFYCAGYLNNCQEFNVERLRAS